jgi:hypothetical protein
MRSKYHLKMIEGATMPIAFPLGKILHTPTNCPERAEQY